MRKLLVACGLVASLAQAQVATYPHLRKTELETIVERSVLLGAEVGGQGAEHIIGGGTAFLYRQDKEYDYYLTNAHVVDREVTSYATYNNMIDPVRGVQLQKIYQDKSRDVAVLVGPRSKDLKPIPVLLDELDIGEETRIPGYPAAQLRITVPAWVSNIETVGVEDDAPIPGYQLYAVGVGGISGSPVLVQRNGQWHWAATVNIINGGYPTIQAIPVRSFYSIIMSLDAKEILDERASVLSAGSSPAQK